MLLCRLPISKFSAGSHCSLNKTTKLRSTHFLSPKSMKKISTDNILKYFLAALDAFTSNE